MNRDVVIAHLSVHGWFPVRSIGGNLGVFSHEKNKGLVPVHAVQPGNPGWDIHVMGKSNTHKYSEEVRWSQFEDVKLEVLFKEIFKNETLPL